MGEMIFLKERRGFWFNPNRLDTGTYAAHTTFRRELFEQQRVNL
jgi:hypothetical protein